MAVLRRPRRVGVLLVLFAVALLATPRPSAAATAPRSGPLTLGFSDNVLFLQSPEAVRDTWLARAQTLGSNYVRIPVYWDQIAPDQRTAGFNGADPADPQYRFSQLDAAVRDAAAHGQQILLMTVYAPTWAERADRPQGYRWPGSWAPDATMYGQFAHALALRYSGSFPDPAHPDSDLPAVTHLQAWNEPNLPEYLSPQWGRTSKGQIVALSPDIYRGLLNAFYSGVKSAVPSDQVLAAATAPYGDAPATGQQRMHPVTFLEDLFCLTSRLRSTSCPGPAHLDAVDAHPYALNPTLAALNPLDISVPDLGKVTNIVNAARRDGHVLPASAKPLWVSEIDWSSGKPLNPSLQARYLDVAFYELWRQGVSVAMWYQLRDPSGVHNSFAKAGLYSLSGQAKPAAAAYRFPFVAMPTHTNSSHFTLWGLAPAAGTVAVQQRIGARWKTIASLRTGAGGIFSAPHTFRRNVSLRAVAGAVVSPVWTTAGVY